MTDFSIPPIHSQPEPLPTVDLYVDGACEPNPGYGGIGVVLAHGTHRKEISRPVGQSTNNACEILAAIEGLKALKTPCQVTLYSDSQYLIRTMRGEFKRRTNAALWALLDSAAAPHTVDWRWLRGHSGDPGNERANALAEQAARRKDVPLFEDGLS